MNASVCRRSFLGGLAGFGVMPQLAHGVMPSLGKERLRIGVFSDLHLYTEKEIPRIVRTLRKFDEWKVDGVLGGSDLTEYGLVQQLRLVAKAWFEVFPDGRASDGRPVANLMHYGDHDIADWYVDRPIARSLCPDDAARHASLIFPPENRKRFWEECFREPYAPITVKTVKGYTFVLSHFTRGEPGNKSGNNVPGLEAVFASLDIDRKMPFFYSQHRIPRGTVGGTDIWGQDDGQTTALFSKYPNLVAFSGHCHMNAANEKMIWQGAFTGIEIPSNAYCVTSAGRENGYCFNDRPPTSPATPSKCMKEVRSDGCAQCMLMTVYDDAIALRRWEVFADAPLGPDWIIPLASFGQPAEMRPFAYGNRARVSVAPQFPDGAEVRVSGFAKGRRRDGSEVDMLTVEFPTAPVVGERLRADDYSVALELKQFDCTRVFLEKRVYSPDCYKAAKFDKGSVKCLFAADEIPAGWQLRFTVRPVNVWGRHGEPISSEWKVLRKDVKQP